tara:strand:- start:21 stop:350 length:330 start_codon:yes stop_codon:yes gene_type:complete
MENIQSYLVGMRRASVGEFGEANLLRWCDSLEEALAEIKKEMDDLKEENEKLQYQYDMAIQVDNKEIASLKEEIEELQDEIAENEEKQKEAWTMGYEERGEELEAERDR